MKELHNERLKIEANIVLETSKTGQSKIALENLAFLLDFGNSNNLFRKIFHKI